MQPSNKKMKTAIIVLSVLLGISVVALAGTMIYKYYNGSSPSKVVVPDNLIDPSGAEQTSEESDGNATDSSQTGTATGAGTATGTTTTTTTSAETTTSAPSNGGNTSSGTTSTAPQRVATSLSLYKGQAEDNTPFKSENLFPGDVETKYFRIKISHDHDVTLRYHADIRKGYEKLAEVLKCRIVLMDTNETLYDGLMRDMPKSVNTKVAAKAKTESERYYSVTAYLDTSVGNDYQDKSLVADFRWWVEETGSLSNPPRTGVDTQIAIWIVLAASSLVILIIIGKKRKKEGGGAA